MKMPLYPMRPTTGPMLCTANVLAVVGEYRNRGYCIQQKLNGDRGILEMTTAGPKLWNRRCGLYRATQVATGRWASLPVGTVLDGEVYGTGFYPFEALQVGDSPLIGEFFPARALATQGLCDRAGVPFLFFEPTDEWLLEQATLKANPLTRMWEGVVAKLECDTYRPLSHPDQESATWVKLKW